MTSFATGMKCRVCGKLYPKSPINFCTDDFGPLEVAYDYESIRPTLSRAKIAARPRTMWRYRELLPLDGEPTVGPQAEDTTIGLCVQPELIHFSLQVSGHSGCNRFAPLDAPAGQLPAVAAAG